MPKDVFSFTGVDPKDRIVHFPHYDSRNCGRSLAFMRVSRDASDVTCEDCLNNDNVACWEEAIYKRLDRQ